MRFFNAQNHGSGYRHPVFLNITSKDCETFEFREEKVDDHGYINYEITPNKNFIRAHKDFRFINYAYAGGVNKCNYDMVKTSREGKTYFTFTLAKATHPSLPEFYGWSDTPLWDFGHAVFKNGSPVITIQLVFSRTGEVESSTFTSLYDLRTDGDLIRFYSESDHRSTRYHRPDQVPSSGPNGEPMSLEMAFSYQDPETDVYRRAVRGLRYNIDDIGGPTSIEPICWFLKNMSDFMAFVMVLDSNMTWDMNAHHEEYDYSVWFSDEPDTAFEYQEETFPGYKGLDL